MIVKKPTQEQISVTDSWGIWEKEVSEFPWFYDSKEMCYILEGEAIITDKQNNSITITPGDWVEFSKGLECTWKITKDIKKRYIFE